MQYVSVRLAGTKRLFMWLPEHDGVVRFSRPASLLNAVLGPLRDWSGAVVTPADGERYLEAAYDRFLLLGLDLQWVDVGRCGMEQPDFLEFDL